MQKERIELSDSILDIVTKMSNGNPGAISVIIKIIKHGAEIDPDSFCGSLGTIFNLDREGIYGSDLWLFYKDVCKENIVNVVGVLRCCQLGELPISHVWDAIRGIKQLDIEPVMELVKAKLPNFAACSEMAQ